MKGMAKEGSVGMDRVSTYDEGIQKKRGKINKETPKKKKKKKKKIISKRRERDPMSIT